MWQWLKVLIEWLQSLFDNRKERVCSLEVKVDV
jgi:hypothetical protein